MRLRSIWTDLHTLVTLQANPKSIELRRYPAGNSRCREQSAQFIGQRLGVDVQFDQRARIGGEHLRETLVRTKKSGLRKVPRSHPRFDFGERDVRLAVFIGQSADAFGLAFI